MGPEQYKVKLERVITGIEQDSRLISRYYEVSSGIRVGAWDYLRWGNIRPVEQNGKIVAAKMIVYAGEDGSYTTYINEPAFRELAEWMKYREESGESINEESWVMRDLWDTRVKICRGLVTLPKQLSAIGVKRLMERAIWAQGLRKELEAGKKRHPFAAIIPLENTSKHAANWLE